MRKAIHALFGGISLAWIASGATASAGPLEIDATMQPFDSVAGRLQLAEILGTAFAIERGGIGQCPFDIDHSAAADMSAWLERPSAPVEGTSPFTIRRDQVVEIMAALLAVDHRIVCDAALDTIPASLKLITRR
jgi:hypothetical protein